MQSVTQCLLVQISIQYRQLLNSFKLTWNFVIWNILVEKLRYIIISLASSILTARWNR